MTRPSPAIFVALLAGSADAAADSRVSYFPVAAGIHPHDVEPAPVGTIDHGGQAKGLLGRPGEARRAGSGNNRLVPVRH